MTKEVDEFNNLLSEARSYTERGNFDKAVLLYSKIRDKFERLPRIRKTEKLIREVNIFYEELSLYLKLNEAYILANQGNLNRLKEVLDYIYFLEIDLEDVQSAVQLVNLAEERRKMQLQFYDLKNVSKKFDEVYRLIEDLIKERRWNSVFRGYAHLLFLYHKLIVINPGKKDELYEKLNRLVRDIHVYKSVHDSYKKTKKKEEKTKEADKIEEKKEKIKEKKELTEKKTVVRFNERKLFRDIRKAIEEGDVEEASMLIES